MDAEQRSSVLPSLVNVAAAMVIFTIAVVALKQLSPLLQPLFIAAFFYYIGRPFVGVLTRLKVPPVLAHLLMMALIVGIFLACAWMTGNYVDDFARRLPEFQSRLKGMFISSTDGGMSNNLPFFSRKLRRVISRTNLLDLDTGLHSFLGNFLDFLWASFLVVLYLIYIIQEEYTLPQRLRRMYGQEKSVRMKMVFDRVNSGITQYIYVKFLASVMKAVGSYAAMVALGLELAPLWSAIIFFTNFIPYLGPIVAFFLPLGMALIQFSSAWKVFALAAIFFSLEMFIGNYWEPRYTGHRLNLSPLVVMASLVFWGWLWGVVGLILAVPILVSLKYIFENIPYTRNIAMWISHEEEGVPVSPPRGTQKPPREKATV